VLSKQRNTAEKYMKIAEQMAKGGDVNA